MALSKSSSFRYALPMRCNALQGRGALVGHDGWEEKSLLLLPSNELVVGAYASADFNGLFADLDAVLIFLLLKQDSCGGPKKVSRPYEVFQKRKRECERTCFVGEDRDVGVVEFPGFFVMSQGFFELAFLVCLIAELLFGYGLLFVVVVCHCKVFERRKDGADWKDQFL